MIFLEYAGGWGGIRTHGTLARSPVFKTGAFNRSATHPKKKRHTVTGLCDKNPSNAITRSIGAVTKAGFSATVAGTDDKARKARREQEKRRLQLELAAGILLTAPLLLDMVGGMHLMLPRWIQLVLATLVQFGLGAKFYRGAWAALRGGGANMDVLVALGTTVAWFASAVITVFGLPEQVWFESGATVLTLVTAGRLMEAGARNRAAAGVERLARLQPVTAHVETPQGVQDRSVNFSGKQFIFTGCISRPGRSGFCININGITVVKKWNAVVFCVYRYSCVESARL